MRILIPTVLLLSLIPFSLYASARSNSGGLANRVAELEAQVEVLAAALQEAQEVLQYVHVETEFINGLRGPHWIIEGANVHVRSGYGNTVEDCLSHYPDFPNCESLTGLGNLIVGYNEHRTRPPPGGGERRTGSHNLVVGRHHSYASFAGFVAGDSNRIFGASATIAGGQSNWAFGKYSSVSGGHRNKASGKYSAVSGGEDREAPDENNWAAGELFEPN